MLERLSAQDARRWAVLARAALAARRAEIDALNVFPVPDGDTGTNLYLTVDGALDAVRPRGARPGAMAADCRALADAMLLSARGNSGVILSQLVRGLADALSEARADTADGTLLATGLQRASERAWRAVSRPVEGTVLSVARAAAEAAGRAGSDLTAVAEAALTSATAALAATRDQLPQLSRAGVVDAGGAGLVVVLEALVRVVHEDASAGALGPDPLGGGPLRRRTEWGGPAARAAARLTARGSPGGASSRSDRADTGGPAAAAAGDAADAGDGPAYEVMYLLRDSDEARAERLRQVLDGLGDSLLVVGGPELWNVHVHVDDAGAALEAGIEAGRPHRVRVTRLPGEHRRAVAAPVGVVACALGEGITQAFRAHGALVVPSGPGRRGPAGDILGAVRSCHALEVVVLPNDEDVLMGAEAAASAAAEEGLLVHVVATRNVLEGIAAVAVFDPAADGPANAAAMGRAAAAVRTGSVTVASRDAATAAGPCRAGDVLGLLDGQVAVVGSDHAGVAGEVADRLLARGGELVTLVPGAEAPHGLADAVAARLRARHGGVEVALLEGGQPLYSLLVGVE